MANLTSDKNLDKHLKIIKSGEENTSLELATEGNGAKVNGDFEVTGKYDTIYLKNNSHIKSDDDINLDAVSGVNVNFRVAGVPYLTWDAEFGLTMKALADADDQVNLVVANNGQFTISTQDDSDNDLADIILDAEGDIILDSNSGKFVAKKAGTEFSVGNSAYAGMILGYTTVGIDAADDSYTLTTSMECLDDAMKVKFVAPPSGAVEIFAQIYFDAARRAPVLGLSDQNRTAGYQAISFPNATDVTNEHLQEIPPSLLGDTMLRPHWVVTGLTAGTAYEWWIGAKTSLGTGGVLRWGGNATNKYPPFIMKATALPAAITDYAVYG